MICKEISLEEEKKSYQIIIVIVITVIILMKLSFLFIRAAVSGQRRSDTEPRGGCDVRNIAVCITNIPLCHYFSHLYSYLHRTEHYSSTLHVVRENKNDILASEPK